MGAGTFLSSRRFWEIRDSYRAGLTPSLPFLPSPQSQLVPQAHLSYLCPQGGPPPTAPLPSDHALYPQIFSLTSPPSEFTSTHRSSPNLHFPQTHLFPPTLTASLRATVLTWSFSDFFRQCPRLSDPHLPSQTLSPPSDRLLLSGPVALLQVLLP